MHCEIRRWEIHTWILTDPTSTACQIAGWFLHRGWVGGWVGRLGEGRRGVKPRPSQTNLLWNVSSINHLLLEVRACIHTSVSGVQTKGSVACCLFLFLLSGCDEEAAVLKCFRQHWDEKEEREKKKSFYTAYSNDYFFFFFPQRLTAGSSRDNATV